MLTVKHYARIVPVSPRCHSFNSVTALNVSSVPKLLAPFVCGKLRRQLSALFRLPGLSPVKLWALARLSGRTDTDHPGLPTSRGIEPLMPSPAAANLRASFTFYA